MARWLPCTLLLMLSACAGALSPDAEPPEVTIAGLGFGRPGLVEQQLRVDLRLQNPNDFDIDVDSLRFALAINDMPFATGRTAADFELPALGETVVPVMVIVPTNELIERVMQLGVERRLDYRLEGEAELGGLLGYAMPFERAGVLALPRIPGLVPPST